MFFLRSQENGAAFEGGVAMEQRRMFTPAFMLGHWFVYPRHGFIENEEKRVFLEPKLLDVLVLLVENADDVVSMDLLLERCWPRGIYGDNPVHKAIAMLRKALGDDAKSPRYIATVRKRGYRLVAAVALETTSHGEPPGLPQRPFPAALSTMLDRRATDASRHASVALEMNALCERSHRVPQERPPGNPRERPPMRFLYRSFSGSFR